MNGVEEIHQKANNFKRSEAALLDILIQVDRQRVFEKKGYPSLHVYCVQALQLTDAQAYAFVGVARKSCEVPELRELVSSGEIQLTQARRIVPVLSNGNKEIWLARAKVLSQRELERELIKAYPERVTKERIRPITETRLEMKVFISPEIEQRLKRMQDVLSQKTKNACSMEEVLAFMSSECLERHDPMRKAERAKAALVARPKPETQRTIPAAVAHQVVQRDRGQCTFILPNGKRCPSRRWLQRHHKTPWAHGGTHELNNLATVCAAHHRHIHEKLPISWPAERAKPA